MGLFSAAAMDECFPEVDFSLDDIGLPNYSFKHISIFDHWLGDDESAACDIFTYASAVESEKLSEYLAGELNFINCYNFLARVGVICNYPGPRRVILQNGLEIHDIFVNSLREKRLMDVFFVADQVRVIGRYDRTDMIIYQNKFKGNLPFAECISRFGLYLL